MAPADLIEHLLPIYAACGIDHAARAMRAGLIWWVWSGGLGVL